MSIAASVEAPAACGHPPRHTSSATPASPLIPPVPETLMSRGEKRFDRDLASRYPKLRKRHRIHADPGESPNAAVHRSKVIPRGRRASENELAGLATHVALIAHGVPNVWHLLPLVDESRRLAAYRLRRVELGHPSRRKPARRISERKRRCGEPACGGRLPDHFGPCTRTAPKMPR